MIDFDNGAKAYVEYVLRTLGLSPTALAKRSGIASTTLTRLLNDRSHKFNLSNKSIQKIASATAINPAVFLDGAPHPDIRAMAAQHATPYVEGFSIVEVHIAHGIWRERALINKGVFRGSRLLPPLPVDGSYFYSRVEDDSAGGVLNAGELLWCKRTNSHFDIWHSLDGTLLIVEERSPDERLSSFTVRSLQIHDGQITLSLPSRGLPDRETNLYPDARTFDSGQVRILGQAQCVVRGLKEG